MRALVFLSRACGWLLAGLMVAGAVAVSLGPPLPVSAHAEYDRSSPADGAVVAEPPEQIEVWFTQELFRRAGANTLVVTAPDGSRVNGGEPVIDDVDRTHITVALLPDLAPGEYVVQWTSLSATDGDEASGEFAFTYDPDATPTVGGTEATTEATPSATAPSSDASPTAAPDAGSGLLDEDGSAFPWWALIAAAALLSGGALGAWAMLAAERGDGGKR
jgi:methionine-rich copper-binding protein CopC